MSGLAYCTVFVPIRASGDTIDNSAIHVIYHNLCLFVLNVNLRGTFLCTHFVLPHLLKQGGGRIINIASQPGYIGGVEVAHYCASKGGVIACTKALAREVATRDVLVNGIAPGPILTDLLASETEAWKATRLAELPIGRFGLREKGLQGL